MKSLVGERESVTQDCGRCKRKKIKTTLKYDNNIHKNNFKKLLNYEHIKKF